jgi:tetratricopeptide (TPR) repeat protein
MGENSESDLLSAKIYMDEAIGLYEKMFCSIFEIKNEEHLMILLNYGNLNRGLGKYQLAEKCYKHIIQNNKSTLLSLNAYQLACNNLSVLLLKQGRWKESLELLKNNIASNNNEVKYLILQNIALVSLFLQENKQAVENLKLLNEIGYTNVASVFSHFSETERENYWSKYSKEQTLINNLIACGTKDPDALSMALNYTLFSKSFLLKYPQLIDNLIKVKHTSVSCSICKNLPENALPDPTLKTVIVSSLRLDGIISAVYNVSRSKSSALVDGEKVFINGKLAKNNSVPLKENDTISVRGYGRFKFKEISGDTRKGRIRILCEVY